MPKLLCDVDNCLLDFGNPFQTWLEARYGSLKGHINDVYWVYDILPIEDRAEAIRLGDDLIREFSEDHSLMGDLPALRNAVEPVRALHDAGWEFIAITACHDHPAMLEQRRANLECVYGFAWPVIHITGLNASKEAVLASYEPTVWVEDNLKNARVGHELGHFPILMEFPYNADTAFLRVPDWSDILSRLTRD